VLPAAGVQVPETLAQDQHDGDEAPAGIPRHAAMWWAKTIAASFAGVSVGWD